MKLTANYHTHTYRCGHALDSDEDYFKGAVELGLCELGFSDHVPFKGYHFPGMRQDYEIVGDYVESITALAKKYSGKLKTYIGYEAEYVPEMLGEYEELLEKRGLQYLICGQHCCIKDGKQAWYNAQRHDEESVKAYADAVIAAIRSGLYVYIAHPDHFMNGYREWDEFAAAQSRRIISEAVKYDIPLEINVAGLRFAEYKHRKNGNGAPIENLYPYPEFWELVSEFGAKAIIGIDAHRKYDFLDGVEKEALGFANDHRIKLLDRIEIKR